MIRVVLLKIFAVIAVVIAASAVAAFAVPPLIPVLEHAAGRALSYELLLRAYLAVIVFLTLWIGTVWAGARQCDHDARLLLRWLWIVAAVLFAVFVLDQKWTITEENSWIRYPTAAALAGAGALLLMSSRPKTVPPLPEGRIGGEGVAPTSPDPSSGRRGIVLSLLALGLLFAAADELLSIHEAIGAALEGAFRLPHVTTDLVTAAYGVIGLGVLVYAFRVVRALAQSSAAVRQMLAIYFAGILLFVFATGFDSVDGIIFSWVRRLTDALTLRGYEFSDAWFIIWKPKLFLNALEEVFELYAAALFAYGAWVALRGGHEAVTSPQPSPPRRGSESSSLSPRPARHCLPQGIAGGERVRVRGGRVLILASAALVILIIALTADTLRLPRSTPLADGSPAIKIAGLKDGLFHTDDLDFHPRWGVMVANESEPSRRGTHTGPGVFTYKDGIFSHLPDPDGKLVDIDSVSADRNGEAIYASAGAIGQILRFAEKWEVAYRFDVKENAVYFPDGQKLPCPKKDKCPGHPEALFALDGKIWVVDESNGVIVALWPSIPEIDTFRPTHPQYKKPEGIIWQPSFEGGLLLTDDTTGTIFRLDTEPPEIFADQSDGLRFPEDIAVGPHGEVIVTDNGAREIIVFKNVDDEGIVTRRLRMRPLYRDLQGVTVDDKGNLYFVTADAFASESFMPSVLWKIEGFFTANLRTGSESANDPPPSLPPPSRKGEERGGG